MTRPGFVSRDISISAKANFQLAYIISLVLAVSGLS